MRRYSLSILRIVTIVLLPATSASVARAQARTTPVTPEPPRVIKSPSTVRVVDGSRLLLQYRRGDVPFKPYVSRLCTPRGVNVLRDSPADHKHHHGLMLALGVDKVDFWSETHAATPGRQHERSYHDVARHARDGRSWSGFSQRIDWIDMGDKNTLLSERREIRVRGTKGYEVTLVTWRSQLEVPAGNTSATLWGRHYFGLGMRFVESMDKNGRFLNAAGKDGEVVRGDERLLRARWCAYGAEVDGRPVTVAMFDHPANPRHPATWFTMAKPFAYLTATLNLKKEQMAIAAGRPLQLCYGIAVWDGRKSSDQIDALYRKWTAWEDGSRVR